MTGRRDSLRVLATTLVSLGTLLSAATAGAAAGGTPEQERISVVNPTGSDISFPQCTGSGWNGSRYTGTGSTRTPTGARFGVVGVNGGTAANANPCLPAQLAWAQELPGLPKQPALQLYVNTANPGAVLDRYTVQTWPAATSPDNPYNERLGVSEACQVDGAGVNSAACSWQYGWLRAEWSAGLARQAAVVAGVELNLAGTAVWLDVETMNTWQGGAAGRERNAAALEGMAARFQALGSRVGLYSTGYQWFRIVGSHVGVTGKLAGLPSWLAGAADAGAADRLCSVSQPLTAGGSLALVQYLEADFDLNRSCVDRH